ncbi:MAG: DUF2975 domain-containing protein [Eubacteriales bacterium]
MKYIGKGSLSSFIKVFIIFLMGVAIGCLIGLPWIFNIFLKMGYFIRSTSFIINYLMVILYITGVVSLIILNEMRKIFNTLEAKDPFIYENVHSLKTMSVCAFVIAVVYITKVIVYNSIMTMLVVLVFFLAGLLALVLSEVFKKAINFKEEIDLTV